MVERAGEKHARSGKIPGVVADAKQGLPFPHDVFSLVFSMRFFHHLHDKSDREAILKEFSRVTSDWVILSFYQRNALHVIQRKLRRRIMKKKTRIMMIPRKEFYQEIEDAGLSLIKVVPLFRGIHAHHIALLKKE
jgi:ubiquinone/menaquinone biosynthesis C-methylase UbiE